MTRKLYYRTTWRMELRQLTMNVHLGRSTFAHIGDYLFCMWTKVHHVSWKTLVRIFPLAPKLSRLTR